MRPKLLQLFLFLTIASFLLLAYGFVTSVSHVLDPKASNVSIAAGDDRQAVKKKDVLQIVSLGDSLTRGVGDKEGTGYIGRIRSSLESQYNQKTALTNLAVSGATAPELIAQLSEKGTQYTIRQADVIVLTMGGNDLFPGWESLGDVDLAEYRPDVTTFAANTRQILTMIRSLNADSPIFWVGLYNPFEDVPELKESSAIVVSWNAALESTALEFPRVYIVPMFDLFQSRGTELLYSDHFHPNEKGYSLIANRLLQNLISELQLDGKEGDGA